jgi:hypothetical protein
MPLPSPKQNEGKAEFIQRCINDPVVKSEFVNKRQAVAVCITQYDKK